MSDARDVVIRNVKVWNQDDTINFKNNTRDVLVENVESSGMGIGIGSLDPFETCQNITFRNIKSYHPIKGIYLKIHGN